MTGPESHEARRCAARAIRAQLDKRIRRANAFITEHYVRDTLTFLGFDEIAPGYFIRPDGVHGRATSAEEARFFTTARLRDLVGSVVALKRIVVRFAGVHGPLVR